jgi:HSP20 family molecular chaperone IbpA
MRRDDLQGWMWSEALGMLTRAEHLHRQFFRPSCTTGQVAWEPPVDVLELEDVVLILIALPGIEPDQVEIRVEDDALLISGRRTHPAELRASVIHRLEIPQGRFERRVPLPPGRYAAARRSAANGCLMVSLHKDV